MPPRPHLLIALILTLAPAPSWGQGTLERPTLPVSTVYCDCVCRGMVTTGNSVSFINATRRFAAPGGDGTRCAGQSGASCTIGNPPVTGSLSGCRAHVERRSGSAGIAAQPGAPRAP